MSVRIILFYRVILFPVLWILCMLRWIFFTSLDGFLRFKGKMQIPEFFQQRKIVKSFTGPKSIELSQNLLRAFNRKICRESIN